MTWLMYLLIWFGYVYVWASYSNKEVLRATEWSEMNYRQKLRRVFLFPSWLLKGPGADSKDKDHRSWLQLWEHMDDKSLPYSGGGDSFPAILFRTLFANSRMNSYKDQTNLVLYKLFSIFPLLGLNVLVCTIAGGLASLALTAAHIPTFFRFLYRTATKKIIKVESEALTFLKAEDGTPYGRIESQKRDTQSILNRLLSYQASLHGQENEIIELLNQYSDEALAKKTTTLGQSNFMRTKALLEEKWQEKIDAMSIAKKKVDDVTEAVAQLQELKTMVAVLQHSTDSAAQSEVLALLQQAEEVCGNAVALETEVSFNVLAEQGDYPLPAPPSIIHELEA